MARFKLRPPTPPRLNENDVERQCLDALRYRHYRPERLHAGTFKSLDGNRFITGHGRGMPDYVVTHALFPAFYLEVKRPGESPSPEQKLKHIELGLDDLAVVWVDDFELLLVWLAEHQQKARSRWRAMLENTK
jgi:hypothetical protein